MLQSQDRWALDARQFLGVMDDFDIQVEVFDRLVVFSVATFMRDLQDFLDELFAVFGLGVELSLRAVDFIDVQVIDEDGGTAVVVAESERVVRVARGVDFFPDLVIEDKELVEPFSGGDGQSFFGIADMDARVRFDESGRVFQRIDLVSLTPVSSVQKFSQSPDAFIEEVIRLDESGRDCCSR